MASQVNDVIYGVKLGTGDIKSIASSAYGECTTASNTAAKVVDMTGFVLVKGVTITVKFTNSNTAENPTLNVNSKGAKPIMRYGTTNAGTTEYTSWKAGNIISLTYDGTNWIINDFLGIDENHVHPYSYSDLEFSLSSKSLNVTRNRIAAYTGVSVISYSLSGDIVTFTTSSENAISELKVNIVAVQSGSGDPSPDNERPISGWTGANIYKRGFNLWDEQWEIGGISSSTGENEPSSDRIRTKNYISVKESTYYYFVTNGKTFGLRFYDKDKNYLSYVTVMNNSTLMPANVYFLRFIVLNTTTYGNNISVNYPQTDTSYHAYNGNTYNINWQSEAGTVYGGTLDVKSGLLTVTKRNYPLKNLTWQRSLFNSIYYYHSTALPNMKAFTSWQNPTDSICDMFKRQIITGVVSYWQNLTYFISYRDNTMYVRWDEITDINDFLDLIKDGNIVYELATPVTYQLTPTEIRSLLGLNNVWADCGDISLNYVP